MKISLGATALRWDFLSSLQGSTQLVFSKIVSTLWKTVFFKKKFKTINYPLTLIKSILAQLPATRCFIANNTFPFHLAIELSEKKVLKSLYFETLVSVWFSVLVTYCWVTNYLNLNGLKQQYIFMISQILVGQEFESSIAGWFLFWFFHGLQFKMSARAVVLWRPEWGLRIHFQGGSFLPLLAGALSLVPCLMNFSIGFLDCCHNMVTDFLQSE